MDNVSRNGSAGGGRIAALAALAVLLLVDAAVLVMLGGTIARSLNDSSVWIACAVLMLAAGGCVARAIVMTRRGRLGAALGLAAVPAVPAALATATLLYLLSHMGAHH